MSKAKILLSESKERVLKKYAVSKNSSTPIGDTDEVLESGVYSIMTDMAGRPVYTKMDINTDELIREGVEEYKYLIQEVSQFWDMKENFKKFGFTHKRGVIMYGAPGSGKTSVINMLIEDTKNRGDVVFIAKSPYDLTTCISSFREVEPDRKALVILEDFDNMLHGESNLLQLLDGTEQVDGVMYIATTNYIENIPERMRKRPSRFDRVVEIGPPNRKGRRIYLQNKLEDIETAHNIESIVEATDGFTFAHLKELIISVYCLENDLHDTVERLKEMSPASLVSLSRSESKKMVEEYKLQQKALKWANKTKILS